MAMGGAEDEREGGPRGRGVSMAGGRAVTVAGESRRSVTATARQQWQVRCHAVPVSTGDADGSAVGERGSWARGQVTAAEKLTRDKARLQLSKMP